ncbi:branched-chain amino acid transport system II carrier protein [Niallia sp. 01092]|uniref:branched-chain amino acid transport system II carrier protein n=1 Tax=unclassified Niallia TaxID=2837522 RepID=UPI003FD2BC4A
MKKNLSFSSYLVIGTMLFGLFFGAGNLIFPAQLGQEAGSHVWIAILGFLVTGIGLPFLGIFAMGISGSNKLQDLASRVHPVYGLVFTIALYLTIGPFFALPRTGTVSYEIGISPFLDPSHYQIGLAVFTTLYFLAVLWFSLNPAKIIVWVGKVLTPVFLVFLGALIVTAIANPVGTIGEPHGVYAHQAFFKGFTEGYNTMDALASLAFGIIVVQAVKGFGVTKPAQIVAATAKAGLIGVLLMAVIYVSVAYMGATTTETFGLFDNGGQVFSQLSKHFFGPFGSILLAIIIILACLKTGIGLTTACAECFHQLFPRISYKMFVILFCVFSGVVANVGLTNIIKFAVPVLVMLYPLAITLMFLTFLSPLFKHRRVVYVITTLFTAVISIVDGLNAAAVKLETDALSLIDPITAFFANNLPLYSEGLGWVMLSMTGLVLGWIVSLITKRKASIQSNSNFSRKASTN